MKILLLGLSFIKIIPIFIVGTANAGVYWLENAGFDAFAQLTPTDKDNKFIVVAKAGLTKFRGLGETFNGWIKKLGM